MIKRKIAAALAVILSVASIGMGGCKKQKNNLDVYLPDGAPALAFALPMYEDNENDNVEYHVVSANTIQTYVTGNQPKAEVCVLPVNWAAKLLGNTSTYKMVGVVTHGNMYLLANEGAYSRENATALLGKTVGVVQLNNVPGLTMKAALADLNVPYNDLSQGGEVNPLAVNLKPVDVKTLVGADLYLLPSPAADMRAANTEYDFVGSLQELYGGQNGYPQAVVVVKNSVLQEELTWVRSLLSKIEQNVAWLSTAEKSVIAESVSKCLASGLAPTFTPQNLTDGAIAHSGIWLQTMNSDTVAEVEDFLSKIVAIDASKAAVPQKNFYEYIRTDNV